MKILSKLKLLFTPTDEYDAVNKKYVDSIILLKGEVKGVKGNDETEYREGLVNITPENIGTYSKTDIDTLIDGFQQKIDELSDKITEMNLPAPEAITDLTSSVVHNSIIFSCTVPINAKGIKLYADTNSSVSSTSYEKCFTLEFTEEKEKLNWELYDSDGFTIGTKYYFVIYAYNNKGSSDASNVINNILKVPSLEILRYEMWKITGNRFNINDNIVDIELTYCKNAHNIFDETDSIETENTLQQMFGNYDYSNSTLYIAYSLDTDCPQEELSNIYFWSKGIKLAQLENMIGIKLLAKSSRFPGNLKNLISNNLNERFDIKILPEDFWMLSEYYFNLTIHRIWFE